MVGGGAREHVIAETLARDGEIYSVMKNRNPGIARLAKEILLHPETDVVKVRDFAVENGIELKVSHAVYRSVDLGDTVFVSRFSDGSYRLDH